jgi:hypothetical protein
MPTSNYREEVTFLCKSLFLMDTRPALLRVPWECFREGGGRQTTRLL